MCRRCWTARPICGICGASSMTSRRITGSWHRMAGATCTGIFPQEAQATLFVYETSLTDDAENPLQRGKQLYYSEDGQPILLLCNISDIVPNTEVELYPSTGEELVFSPFLSGENGHVVEARACAILPSTRKGTTGRPTPARGRWKVTGWRRPRHRRGLF